MSVNSPVVFLLESGLVKLPWAEIVRDAGENSLMADICGQLSSRYEDKIHQWPQKVVIVGYGQGRKWQHLPEE